MPTDAIAAVEPVRHLVEVDTSPDQVSYFLRRCASSARLWGIQRLGAFRSLRMAMPGVDGQHLPGLAAALTQSADHAGFANLYRRQFDSARSLKVLRIGGALGNDPVIEGLRPDILVCDVTEPLPGGYREKKLIVGSDTCRVGYASEHAEKALERHHLGFMARSEASARDGMRVFRVTEVVLWDGFHYIEGEGAEQWVWSGVGQVARLLVPSVSQRRQQRVTLFFYGNRVPITSDSLSLTIDGRAVEARYFPYENKIEADFEHKEEAPSVAISLHHSFLGSTDDGSRRLGVALNRIRLEAL